MIKLVIFDLDGVLIDTREIHYEVLNKSLLSIDEKYTISHKDHLSKFDGLSTNRKLEILSNERGLPKELHKVIWEKKQELTIIELEDKIKRSDKLINIINILKSKDIKVYVASNSIKKTIEISLDKLGISDLIDGFLSNEDVLSPKPHPEIYMRCMINEKVMPSETLILEDSYIGRLSAISSGANICSVNNPDDVTIEKIEKSLKNELRYSLWSPSSPIIIFSFWKSSTTLFQHQLKWF